MSFVNQRFLTGPILLPEMAFSGLKHLFLGRYYININRIAWYDPKRQADFLLLWIEL